MGILPYLGRMRLKTCAKITFGQLSSVFALSCVICRQVHLFYAFYWHNKYLKMVNQKDNTKKIKKSDINNCLFLL